MTTRYGNRWITISELGRGGQGVVHKVKDDSVQEENREEFLGSFRGLASGANTYGSMDRDYETFWRTLSTVVNSQGDYGALKLLHNLQDARDPERASDRIEREIDVMSKNLHPHLLRILDKSRETDSEKWYVSEFHPGGTLDKRLDNFAGKPLEALRVFRPLVEAVSVLHQKGFVHRDIKPHNVFLSFDGKLILGDFGLVYFESDGTRLSATNENVGSRDWMPGWAQGVRVDDVKSSFDVYSLGKLLWSMVSGKRFLRFWYFDEEEFNIELQFPDD